MLPKLLMSLTLCAVFAAGLPAAAQTARPTRIGVVLDGSPSKLDALLERVATEASSLASPQQPIAFPRDKRRVATFDAASVSQHLDALLADPDVDIVVGFGILASNELTRRSTLPKPALAPFVVTPPEAGAAPPSNVSTVHWPIEVERDMALLGNLGARGKVAWLEAPYTQQLLSPVFERARRVARARGLELVRVAVSDDAGTALAALPQDIQGAYLAPNPQLSQAQLAALVEGLRARKLVTFSWLGTDEVRLGILAGVGAHGDVDRLVRQVALNLNAIAAGARPSSLTAHFLRNERLRINLETARAIGIRPDWSLLLGAQLLHEERPRAPRPSSLQETIAEALHQNLDLATLEFDVAAGAQEVLQARASLLPQLEGSLTGVWIDEDRAGLGRPQRALQWSATLTQPLYSENAWANFSIQQHLQQARLQQRRLTQLDVATAAALGYLTILRAETAQRIRRQTLEATHQHLATARLRVAVGVANEAEVARWESQLADARRDLMWTVAQRKIAEFELNRLVNRPLRQPFAVAETTLDDVALLGTDQVFRQLLRNQGTFEALGALLARQAVQNAPELHRLGSVAAAKSREEEAAHDGHFLPTVALVAGATHRFLQGGAGSEDTALPLLPGGQELPIPTPDGLDWQVGIKASLPLFEGGARVAAEQRAHAELSQIQQQRRATERLVEQRVLTALVRAGAALPSIEMAQVSQRAAKQTLELTENAYAQGTATLIQMLDAEQQAAVSELAATNATYDYLMEAVHVERALGRLDRGSADKAQLTRRMQALLDATRPTASATPTVHP